MSNVNKPNDIILLYENFADFSLLLNYNTEIFPLNHDENCS